MLGRVLSEMLFSNISNLKSLYLFVASWNYCFQLWEIELKNRDGWLAGRLPSSAQREKYERRERSCCCCCRISPICSMRMKEQQNSKKILARRRRGNTAADEGLVDPSLHVEIDETAAAPRLKTSPFNLCGFAACLQPGELLNIAGLWVFRYSSQICVAFKA